MVKNRIKPFGLTFLFTLIGLAGTTLGSPKTIVFVPSTSPDANGSTTPYYTSSKKTDEIGYAPVNAGVNVNTGYVSVYTSAWIGGSAASAWQCIAFETFYKSSVKAEVHIDYVGDTVNFGPGSFSDTAWQWQLDNHSSHRNDINPAFTWETVGSKILDIVLSLLGECGIAEIEEAAEIGELIVSAADLASSINDAIHAGDGEHLVKTFTFTAEPGMHTLWVGIRADASGCVTGSGFGIMFGQIPRITLTIDDGYTSDPDLTIEDIDVSPVQLKRNQNAEFEIGISNLGAAPIPYETNYAFAVREPNDANYAWVVFYDKILSLDGYTTVYREPNYTFNKKGTYSFKAIADRFNWVTNESNETNNEMIKEYYVKGLPPNKPSKPTLSSSTLYRNNTYTFCTSATDDDNDLLKYKFFFYDVAENQYFSIWNSSDTNTNNGWTDCNCILYDPGDENGTYYAFARAVDSDGLMSETSDQAVFVVMGNSAPDAPDINAPGSGYTNDTISFTVSSSDKENDRPCYRFDWGDGSAVTNYIWPAINEVNVTLTHKFTAPGTYNVQVQAQDIRGAASSWSSHQINITDYVPPAGSITVTTNNDGASFSISGPNIFNGYGTHWSTQAPVGYYTITFYDLTYYETPASDAKQLDNNQSITFDGEYKHEEGDIDVNTNNSLAFFRVTGHGAAKGGAIVGQGRLEGPTTATAGEWSIKYDSVPGFCVPVTNNEKKSLYGNQSIVFNGRYTLPPVASLDINMPSRGFAIKGEDALEFDASASHSQESDLSIVKYEFDFGDGEKYAESSDVNAPDGNFDGKTVHVYTDRGYYSPTLFVYDNLGNKVRKDANEFQVKSRPIAYISSINPLPAIDGETVAFSGRGVDYDGDAIIGYEWQSNIDGNLPYVKDFNTNHLTPGNHTISFRVEDSNSLWSSWVTKQLNVYKALDWPMFKDNAPRTSNQGTYYGRLHGMLGYDKSWNYLANGPITGSPVAANLDGNSINGLEIAFATQAGAGNLYVLNNQGALRWLKNIGSSKSTPAIGDIDNDGNLDIVIGSVSAVRAYNKDGNSIYTFNDPVPGQGFDSTPIIADIDADPNNGKETIIGNNDGHVYAIDKNGNQRWAFASPMGLAFTGSAAVADIEPLSPGLETVIAGNDGTLYVLSSNGFLIASYATPAPIRPITTTPAIVNLYPGTPGPEIVFGSDDGHLYNVNYNNFTLTLSWSYATGALLPVRSSPAIGVMYGGVWQVVFGCDDGKVYVLQDNGGAAVCIGTFQCGGIVRSTPVIANIDSINNIHPVYGDLPEVIVGAADGKLYGISFGQGVGTNLPWSPLNNLSPGVAINSSPAVADINHEPDLEILIGSNNNNLYMITAKKNPALAPAAQFSAPAIQRVGNPPLDVNFIDQSTNTPISWLWDFGDYSTSTDQNPNHIYTTPGTYSVRLTVTNPHGSNSITESNYITVNPVPVADFTCSTYSGTVPLQVNFSDQSQYSPTSWSWAFGDSNTSSSQNPSHTYTDAGLYTVTLTAGNAYGSDAVTKTDCILVKAPQPVADFTQDVTSGPPPLSISFTDLSTGQPTSWLWNLGDGNTSSQQNPSHQYSNAGNFLASLTVSNSTGSDTKTNSFYIRVGHKLCDFNHDGIVDFEDLKLLVNNWLQTDSVFVGDITPSPNGDGTVNLYDFARFAQDWLQ